METKESKFNKLILPKMKELLSICNESEIPFFMAFGTDLDENGKFIMHYDAFVPEMFGEQPADHRFANFINIVNGFNATPPYSTESMVMDDFNLSDDIMKSFTEHSNAEDTETTTD